MSYRYSLLPTHSNGPDSPRKVHKFASNLIANVFLSRRYARFSLLVLFSLACFAFVIILHNQRRLWPAGSESWSHYLSGSTPTWSGYPVPQELPPVYDPRPPLYQRYTAYEDRLPQHNESLSFPDDSSRKYVSFADHTWGLGWGNVMQEMVMNAQLAYESGRTFVFDDYVWKRDAPYADYAGKLIPSRVPTSALVAGPIAGQPYSNSTIADTHPRAVSQRYFKQVCPEPYILDPRDILSTVGADASAIQVMSAFVEKLQSINDRCVEIQKDTTQVFDYRLIGSTRLHDVIPTLVKSPIMRDFAWSPLINYAFQKNLHHFIASRKPSLISMLSPFLASKDSSILSNHEITATPSISKAGPLPILALHLRRGDFVEHCDNLYDWKSTYTGFNTQPSLPDRFFMENATLRDSMSADEMKEAYKQKCLIDIDEVRKRVIRVVKEWRAERLKSAIERKDSGFSAPESEDEEVKKMLRKVYIMTNGDRQFLSQLKSALMSDAQRSTLRADYKFKKEDAYAQSTTGSPSSDQCDYDFVWSWDEVSTSRDLDIGWETKYVAQAMDMYVGQRAEVFVGNGFSSLTANVVLLRTVAGVEPWRTRFW